ncbi:MAG: MATE family efflux transporter [Lachnospiraceae bacterium]|nr:MATE family efflux transporter [Lachnospiraceae bacterium]
MVRGMDKDTSVNIKKEIARTLIVLSIPTILEEILSTLFQYVDTAMVGHLGESATASVSVTTTITWLVNSISHAISIAILAMVAKAFGAKDENRIRKISMQALMLAVVCGIITGGISLICSPYIPIWMGADKSVIHDASEYFFIISIPMLFRTASIILGAAIRATKNTKTPMLISLFSNILNTIMNTLLIYILDMGVAGAAIASATSYVFSGTLMFIVYRRNKYLNWKFKEFTIDGHCMEECAKIGIPVLASSLTSCLGYVVFAGMVSGMGTTIFAAHSLAVTAETIFYIPGYGLRTATSTLVGISLGENDGEKFRLVSKMSIIFTVGMMVVSGVVLYFVAYPLMCLLTSSRPAAELGAEMLKMVSFSEPFFGIMIVMEGIFYGLGRTKYAFFVETFSMWGIRIFFTFICVKIFALDLRAVWYCMIADNVVKAVLLAIPAVMKRKMVEFD